MPARRPFTDVGRRMGRLKIMVVGRKGAGKSSLIRSMVQVCEDIVHIDPVQERGSWGGGMEWRGASGTTRITEIAASSRPLPGWWAELNEGAGMAKRRNSVTDVLDRNITFVDTPGLGRARDEELLRYVEGQSFKSISTATMSDTELLQLMCGNGSQVDLVLFLFGHQEELDVEMQMLERLAQSTNVIPIISRCDLLSEEQLGDHHARIADAVSSSFLSTTVPTAPYVVSSAPGPDDEIDASLLMSSTYLAPLHPSDLDPLVHWLFHPDNIAYLRASAAHKVVQWRKRAGLAVNPRATDRIPPPFSRIPTSPLSGPRAPSSSPSSSAITAAFPGSAAAFRAHVTREERLAQLRLSRWATELRGTVSAERERYERLTGDERAEWLARQLEREVARGGLVICEGDGRRPDEQRGMGSSSSARRRRRKVLGDSGVPAWARRAEKERVGSLGGVAWQTVQLLSGVSFVGAVLIAVVRGWGKQGEALNWGWGW
ncbi:hypothetical protein P152DRAFT_391009 [Eremomyces bilateralis CBS 781.70]|uniref:Septin-type G domain-containing protein n=1 Tax=Eremomyces bilateralis CBS 781.70 TaxID=1392243 RepID=A0A6G1GBP6_9PEZI|nr:uncharacterized protein P152DRAFT_391009 [Eremomyces bilateralis CBS 781.70]KAF1815321.1 hypothetical protein P152DRAFT_391009 [Eremomyces bilateralis CBS 781.70]